MIYRFRDKAAYIKLFEFFVVSTFILFFLSKMLFLLITTIKIGPKSLDTWFMCYVLERQAEKISSLNLANIWDGGFFYPFNSVSLLFDETPSGVALLIAPIRMFVGNIFLIFWSGVIAALFLSWIFTYYFINNLGGAKAWSFCAAATFCLSGVSLSLSQQYIFWPFFLIPLLGMITLKIFSTSKLYWGILWGMLFGYLAWSSAHLFVMGGLFLVLFILWNLVFNCCSKKILLILLIAFIFSCIIASTIFVPMYFTHKAFGFYRDYYLPYEYSSNFANLIYREWPAAPLNPIARTPWWGYLKANAKGAVNIGVPLSLLVSALIIIIIRLKGAVPVHKISRYSKRAFISAVVLSVLLACFNMRSLTLKSAQLKLTFPELAVGLTYFCYVIIGIILYLLRRRLVLAAKHPDFFFLLSALLFGILAFGPYYLGSNSQVIASPSVFFQYHVPGLSGIHATARWGLLSSFTLSMAAAIFLSKCAKSRWQQVLAAIFMLMAILEVSPGFRMPDFKNLSPYKWAPRETDIFLKKLPDRAAVLELSSYPLKQEHLVNSVNSLGYALFSSLYHKKPLVAGYSSHSPYVISKYLFYPKDKTLSAARINTLRKFGAKYWVFHIEDWPLEEIKLLEDPSDGLKKIAELDNGKTLIFEDSDPKASVTYYDVRQD